MPLDKIATAMAAVGFEIVEFGEDLAMICGDLSVDARDLGLSLGDRACLALARQRAAVALTADAVWERVPGVNVRLLHSAGA